MRKLFTAIFVLTCFFAIAQSEQYDLSYFLPDVEYDESVPTPKEFLGHEVGEWHVTHDKLYYYMKELADVSDRIVLREYARSHENRPLIVLTITSPENHNNLESIKAEHKKLTDTELSRSVNIDDIPIVIYQGCSIHGNEASGSNGALAMVYYLAAAKGERIERLLDEAVILFDPSYNPDGLHRFSTWVNSHRGKHLISDPVSREFNEVWPGGRTNHYWFDLNRDWLLLTHPESRGRVVVFHEWKPDILTDHHEMGSNSTFYYQPGIPSRTNPNTPQLNQDLTAKIGDFHGRALDRIGSLYYTKESFDDYYYGKGSTYPDAQGTIGILFEQGSSRGHLQQTIHGELAFPFAIRNQVTTMFSTQDAGIALRKEILEYKRESFLEGRELAKENPVKAYVFAEQSDPYKTNRLVEILLSHDIEVHHLAKDHTSQGHTFEAESSFVVSLDQDQYRLAKSIFEEQTIFYDSLFYDVSAWTLPMAFDIPSVEVKSNPKDLLGDQVSQAVKPVGGIVGNPSKAYAYLVEWHQYLAPRMLFQMKEKGLAVKLANESFEIMVNGDYKTFNRGTLIVHSGNNQKIQGRELAETMIELAGLNHLIIHAVETGIVRGGVNLGTRSADALAHPKPVMLIGEGVRSYNAGEVWHHFDQVLEMPVPMLDIADFSRADLSKYNTLIMPDGSYGSLNRHKDKIKNWVSNGGNLVALAGAVRWLNNQDLIDLDFQTGQNTKPKSEVGKFADQNEERGSRVTGGMIAEMNIDITHPLFYGYYRSTLPVFKRGNDYYKPKGRFNTPGRYTSDPVLSGYLHKENESKMKNAAGVMSLRNGRGNIITLVDNPLHRGYWWGGSRLFANAVFFADHAN